MVKSNFKYYKLTFFTDITFQRGGTGFFASKKSAFNVMEQALPERGYKYVGVVQKITSGEDRDYYYKLPNSLMWHKYV